MTALVRSLAVVAVIVPACGSKDSFDRRSGDFTPLEATPGETLHVSETGSPAKGIWRLPNQLRVQLRIVATKTGEREEGYLELEYFGGDVVRLVPYEVDRAHGGFAEMQVYRSEVIFRYGERAGRTRAARIAHQGNKAFEVVATWDSASQPEAPFWVR